MNKFYFKTLITTMLGSTSLLAGFKEKTKINLTLCLFFSFILFSNLAVGQVNPGSISGNQEGCLLFNPDSFISVQNASSSTGCTIQYSWFRRFETTCGSGSYGSWSESPNNTAQLDIGPSSHPGTTQWRRGARCVGTSSWTYSNSVSVMNYCIIDEGIINGDEEGCFGFDPVGVGNKVGFSSNGGSIEFSWQKRAETGCGTGQFGAWINDPNTGPVINIGPHSINGIQQWRRGARIEGCGGNWTYSNIVDVKNYCIIDEGIINGDEEGCFGFDPVGVGDKVGFSSNGGSIEFSWQKRAETGCGTGQFGAWIDDPNTGPVINIGPHSINGIQQWRRGARIEGCGGNWTYSNIVDVKNYCIIDEGIINGDEEGCFGFDPVGVGDKVGFSSNGGSIEFSWQKRAETGCGTGQFGAWIDDPNTGPVINIGPHSVNGIQQWRRGARIEGCGDNWTYSNIVDVKNYCIIDEGIINGDEEGCFGFDPVGVGNKVGFSSNGGSIEFSWQKRAETGCGTGQFGAWIDDPNTGPVINIGPHSINGTQQWRRGARIEGCGGNWTYSNTVDVTNTCDLEVYTDADQFYCDFVKGSQTFCAYGVGGSDPYSYSWSDGLSTGQCKITGSTSTQTFYVTVTDANGCTATDNITINIGDFDVDAGADQSICNGSSTTLTANTSDDSCIDCCTRSVSNTPVNSGCSNSSYVLNVQGGGTNANYSMGSDLEWKECGDNAFLQGNAGPYYIDVVFSNKTTSPPPSSPKIGCGGSNTSGWEYYPSFSGTLTQTNTGDVLEIWRDDAAFQVGNDANITGDGFGGSGWFNVNHLDANGNPVSGGINQGDFNLMLSSTCTDLPNDHDISYNWSNGSSSSSINVNPSSTTTYTVTVTDCEGCEAIDQVTVNVGNINADAGPDVSICNGGSVILTASGGNSYSWSNGSNGSSITVSPSNTTTYTVTATSSDGCSDTDQVTVTVNDDPNANISGNTNVCPGFTTTLTASGGNFYIWSNSASTASITVGTGTYTVTVVDNNGCTDVASHTINEYNAPVASISGDTNVCPGFTTTLTASGGNSYSWSNGASGSSINVGAGTYTVTATDGNGCTDTESHTINEYNAPVASISGDTNVCPGFTTTLTASGGNSYSWSNGASGSSINVGAGTYTVTATDGNGCTDTESHTINEYNAPVASISGDTNVCSGFTTTLTASGGNSYSWSNGASGSSINVGAGTYTVTATDGNGCTDTESHTINEYNAPVASISGDTNVCPGFTTTLTASGGNSYSWSNGASGSSINVGAGTYTVTATDGNGCTDTEQTVVIEKPEINSGIAGPAQRCAGEDAQFQVSPTVSGATYAWSATGNPSITGGSATGSNIIYNWPNVPGIYTVTLVVSYDGCTKQFDHEVNVTQQVIANAGPDQEICQGVSTTLDASQSSGFSAVNWTIISGDFFSIDNGVNTVSPNVSPLSTTEYEITVSDPVNNCISVDRVIVYVNVNLNPTAVASGPDPACVGEAFNLIGSNSLAPVDNPGATLDYFWFNDVPPAGFIANIADPSVTITENTTYTLIVADGACSDTVTVFVPVEGCSSIGDFIFVDSDGDGIQDAGEQGLGGVTLTLTGSKDGTGAAITMTAVTSDGTQDVDGDGIIDPLGYYNFVGLTPGSYFVSYAMPNGYSSSPANQGGNDNNDSDFAGTTNSTAKIVVGPNDQIDDIDGGLYQPASISGNVEEDTNNDDNPDQGVPGVTLTLIDKSDGSIVATTTTNTAPMDLDGDGVNEPVGAYYFGNLAPGNYTIVETQPAGFDASVSDEDGSNDGDPNDGNDPVNDEIPVTLISGEDDEDNDFVDEQLGSIAGVVSEDTNNDDAPDAPIGGVTLTLVDKSNGATVATTTTNTAPADLDGDGIAEPVGAYYFGNLPAGNYTVVETQPAGFDASVSDEDGSNDGDANDGNDPVNDEIPVTLTPGEDDEDNDFIEEQLGSIAGVVSEDTNNDDAPDQGLGGVTLTLVDKTTGATVATTTTNTVPTDLDGDGVAEPVGAYYFGNVPPGNYTVVETQPAGFDASVSDEDGSNDGDANDGNDPVNDEIPVTLTPGEDDEDNDFIDEQLGSIAGVVSEDTNNDDAPDQGVGGVTLTLVDKTTGATVATTTTNTVPTDLDGDGVAEPVGAYYFGNVPPGNYTVVETQPAGFDASVSDEDGSNDGDANDGNDPVNDEIPVTLTPGEDDEDNDFVEEQLGSIAGVVSEDTNNDDAPDAPIGGVTLTLVDKSNGATVATTTTNTAPADLDGDGIAEPVGAYYFGNLPTGNYTVVETQPAGFDASVSDEDGSNDGDANDGNDPVNDEIPVTLTPGEDDEDNDFVEEQLGSIAGVVSEDTNNDDAPDQGVGGVTLTLVDKTTGATVATTTTNTVPTDLDGDGVAEPVGAYYFGNVPPGNYTVVETQPAGFDASVSDEDGSNDGDANDGNDPVNDEIPVTLTPGEDDEDNDFIEEQLGSIAGVVSEDTNNDDAPDQGVGGVTLTLVDKTTGATVATTTTNTVPTDLDGDGVAEPVGAYYFGNVPPGNYTVVETQPAGFDASVSDEDGSNDGDANDGNDPVNDEIPVTLTPGEDDEDNDFIEEQLGSIAGVVSEDTNNDDAPDAPIGGVTLTLVDKSNGATVATTTTNTAPADLDGDGVAEPVGAYYFGNLPTGNYTVVETQPAGFDASVSDEDGSNDGDANDGNDPVNDEIPVTLTPGEDDEDNDFVEEKLGAIEGIVSEDTNNDDSGDSPIGGNTITLVDKTTGATVATTTTNTVPTDLDGDGTLEPVGAYYFGGLAAGNYTVLQPTQPANLTSVSDTDSTPDGDAADGGDPVNEEIPVTLTPGETDSGNDFIEEGLLSIGSRVWNDENNNGLVDAGEAGIPGVLVQVYADANADGIPDSLTPVGSDVTGADGSYVITNLAPGTYVVVVPFAPTGTKSDGSTDNFISSGTTNTGDNSTDDDDNGTQIDTDADGIKDGPTVSPTITLTPGGEATGETGVGGNLDPTDANGDMTIDFGFFLPAHIGDMVWFDEGNGTAHEFDGADTPIAGVVVNLLDAAGNPVLDANGNPTTTVTDNMGLYMFDGVAPGSYSVEFILPNSSLTFLNPDATGNDANDSDAIDQGNGSSGITSVFTIAAGDVDDTRDAGLKTFVVPVDAEFYGRHNADRARNELTWITLSEINNDKFILERALNSQSEFEAIAEIDGNGNSTQEITYEYNDLDVNTNGLYLYRLRQIDFDGTETLIGPVAIRIDKKVETLVEVYPNPAQNEVTVSVTTDEIADMKVVMYDISGKLIAPDFASQELANGENKVNVSLDAIPAGSYVLRITVGKHAFIKKLAIID